MKLSRLLAVGAVALTLITSFAPPTTAQTLPVNSPVYIPNQVVAPVTLTTTVSGSALTLNWANYGTLLSATNLAGPWVPVTGAVSPFTIGTTNAAAEFFRIKIH